PGFSIAVDETVAVLRRAPHQRRSHSLPPAVFVSSLVVISIAPCGSIFTPATRNPAAITALTAFVRSLCRKGDGRRGFIFSLPLPSHRRLRIFHGGVSFWPPPSLPPTAAVPLFFGRLIPRPLPLPYPH